MSFPKVGTILNFWEKNVQFNSVPVYFVCKVLLQMLNSIIAGHNVDCMQVISCSGVMMCKLTSVGDGTIPMLPDAHTTLRYNSAM